MFMFCECECGLLCWPKGETDEDFMPLYSIINACFCLVASSNNYLKMIEDFKVYGKHNIIDDFF